ncbi:MAG: endonuclease/exonuclease/phosphatase family protein [Bacteroidia bacterium]
MKKSLKAGIIFLFILISTSKAFSQEKNYKVGVIGFYNLENLFDTINEANKDEEFLPDGSNHYTSEVYIDKLGKLSSVISLIGSDMSPDGLSMMGCAEVENESVLKDLINTPKLKSRNYKIVHYDSPDERGIDVGLIYNPKYFTVKSSESLFVELYDDAEKKLPRLTRDVLFVFGIYDGEPLYVFVNHWPSRRGGEEASAPGRAKAAGVCKHKIDSITKLNPGAKIIVMGDLNDDPVSPSVAVVLNAKGDKKNVKLGGLYNPWTNYYTKGIGTLAYNDAWNLFDQIMLSSAWLDKKQSGFFFKEADIFHKAWMEEASGKYKGYPKRTYAGNTYIGGYSDHFPTYVVLLKESK